MDYNKLIHTIVDPFINNPDSIIVREIPQESERDKTFLIVSNSEDTAHLIGKKDVSHLQLEKLLALQEN